MTGVFIEFRGFQFYYSFLAYGVFASLRGQHQNSKLPKFLNYCLNEYK